jgi:hypothetical protein
MTGRWTDHDLVLMWRCGYQYALGTQPIVDALSEAHTAPLTPAEPTTGLGRYLRRMEQAARDADRFHACYGTREWAGAPTLLEDGSHVLVAPVPWDTHATEHLSGVAT